MIREQGARVGVTISAADDAKLKERLEKRTRGIPVRHSLRGGGHSTDRARRDTACANQSALVLEVSPNF